MKWGLQYINPKMIDLLNDLFQWLLENVYFLNNLKKIEINCQYNISMDKIRMINV
jgi:hypothetical protein